MTPTLKTARLTLATPVVYDKMNVGHYVKWLSNEEVTRYSEQRHYSHTEETQRQYIASFAKTGDHFWEISRSDTPIGSITASIDKHNNTANVGVMIGAVRMWREGYASEAWDAVCTYLFESGIRKVDAGCMACNGAMRKILEKNGFVLEATLPGHFLLNGKPEDCVCYGKTAEAKIIPLKKAARNS